MTQPDDRDLEQRFAAWRREQREAAPTFAGVTAGRVRQRERRVPIAWALAATVAAVIVAGILVGRNAGRETRALLDLHAARWTAPTDFLLNVPGSWLLRDLPGLAVPASMQFDTVSYQRTTS